MPPIVPTEVTLDHYRALFEERQFWRPMRNSLVVAAATTALAIFAGTLAAYALTRLSFRGRTFLLAAVLAVSMLPQVSLVPPLYLALRAGGLIDSYTGLVLPYLSFALPLSIWLLVGYFRQLPPESRRPRSWTAPAESRRCGTSSCRWRGPALRRRPS